MSSINSLLVACSLGYDAHQADNWVLSARNSGYTGDIVILSDLAPGSYSHLRQTNVKVIRINRNKKFGALNKYKIWRNMKSAPHVERFYHIYEFLRGTDCESVITTDIKDVIFQINPDTLLEKFKDVPLIVGGEGLSIKNEDWGFENLMNSIGSTEAIRLQHNEVLNVGVLLGRKTAILALAHFISVCSIGRPDRIADQSMFNWILHNNICDLNFKITNYSEPYICHLGTILDERIKERYAPFLLHGELPYFAEGRYFSATGQLYHIVHQYDRVTSNKIRKYS